MDQSTYSRTGHDVTGRHTRCGLNSLIVAFCVFFLALLAEPAVRTSSGGEAGREPWTGAPGIEKSVTSIMDQERAAASQGSGPAPRQQKPLRSSDRRSLAQNPLSQKAPGTGNPAQTTPTRQVSRTVTAAQTVGVSFLGAQSSESAFIPPDTMGDVGPTQIMVCLNGRFKLFDKTGVLGAINTTPETFFSPVTGNGVSDPRVRYDRLSQRWFITAIDIPKSSKNNKILVAVSSGPTITSSSSFTFYAFQHNLVTPAGDTGDFADYPTLAVDRNALYVGVNVFSGNSYAGTTGYVINKANLLAGSLTVTAFRQLASPTGPGPYTPYGVDNDDPNSTEGYFVGVDNLNDGLLVIRRVSDPGGTPSISTNINLTVPATGPSMAGVVAKGVTTPLDDVDNRLFAARMHKGRLWTAHNIEVDPAGAANASGGRDGARWYEITNLTSTPVLRQSGTLFDPSAANPASYFIPSCAVNGQGHMAIACTVAGTNQFAEIAVAGRLATDPLGQLQPAFVAQTSSTPYNVGSGTPRRWGDYSVVSVDPTDDMTLWAFQEYCNATNSWGVRVIQLLAPPPSSPTACIPSSVPGGAGPVVIDVTGTSSGGSGFYDPGTNYSKRLSATFNDTNITVTGVNYLTPTHITISVVVSNNATLGNRTLTVTNPDGQVAASASGILTITAPNTAPTIASVSDKTINAFTRLTVTNTASDADVPTNTLTFALVTGPTSMSVDPVSGILTWLPTQSQAASTNTVMVSVTDDGLPHLSATNSFKVVVNPIAAPGFLPALTMSLSGFRFVVSGDTGQAYDIQTSTNLTNWVFWQRVTNASGVYTNIDTTATNTPMRFYRAVLGP